MENNDDYREILFKKVFCNIVILDYIYNFVRLYKRNKIISFLSKDELLKYKEIQYVSKIIYNSQEMLDYGDLPNNGVLKHIVFGNVFLSSTIGANIPNGVKIIEFFRYGVDENINCHETTDLSTLPLSVRTVKNVSLIPKNSVQNQIPPNIKSISFGSPSFNLSSYSFGSILPNTIRKLSFNSYIRYYNGEEIPWDNQGLLLKVGDLPNAITSLSIPGYKLEFEKHVLPSTILKLKINRLKPSSDYFETIPPNVEKLTIVQCLNLENSSNLFKCNSIKKLKIGFNNKEEEYKQTPYYDPVYSVNYLGGKIEPYSLPSSLTKLSIKNITKSNFITINSIPKGLKKLKLIHEYDRDLTEFSDVSILSNLMDQGKTLIPNSVVDLKINKIITQNCIFPKTLKSLHFGKKSTYINSELSLSFKSKFNRMIEILPSSLTLITLPKIFDIYNFKFPPTITLHFIEQQ